MAYVVQLIYLSFVISAGPAKTACHKMDPSHDHSDQWDTVKRGRKARFHLLQENFEVQVKYALLKYRFSSLNTVYLCAGVIVRYISLEVYQSKTHLHHFYTWFWRCLSFSYMLVWNIDILSVNINLARWSVMICDLIVMFDFYLVCRWYMNLGWTIVIEKNVKCFDWKWKHSLIKQKVKFIYLVVPGSY
jgi:hypothetical protein